MIRSFSGSSSGSGGSIPHSFSVDEIQKMRVKLKSSKSYPNELLLNQQSDGNAVKKTDDNRQQQPSKILTKDRLAANHDECDNSSSGVSSDQEVTASNVKTVANKTTTMTTTINNLNKIISTNAVESSKQHGILKATTMTTTTSMANKNPTTIKNASTNSSTAAVPSVKIVETINKKAINLPPLSNVTKKISAAVSESAQNANDDFDDFDELPAKGFQRQVSLTRKQAATIAMNRSMYSTKSAVSLTQLPPPIEGDSDDPDHQQTHCQSECRKNNLKVIYMSLVCFV